ncbi:IPT/TIG domain-containing protein [Cognataquiflexum aquatile]|uniref:IPT/TIG domain-containing protein n=1 Tax=Cognataquiflexum aquatile TaxID=2249427 RepID=UPI000DEBDCC0|nr:IPT/TIG domain-containing protein [Cognataquiflexum aquatile]
MVRGFPLLVLVVLLLSCNEKENVPTFALLTENPLDISGESAKLVGRLITNEKLQVDDHGFWVDTKQEFSDPSVVSLGVRNGPGRFIGEIRSLAPGRIYYVKSFTQSGGDFSFGNVIQLNSLSPGIYSFSPQYASPGQIIEILGLNLGADTRVFFDDTEAAIQEIVLESLLRVTIPPIQNNPSPFIKVISNGVELVFDIPFEYMVGKFRPINFPETFRLSNSVSFQANGKVYVGSGQKSEFVINSDYWEFDPITDNWEKLDLGIKPHLYGFGVSGYFGGGSESIRSNNQYTFNKAFWFWDGNGLIRKADLPFKSINSIAFESNGRIYVLGGSLKEFETSLFEYTPETDSWKIGIDFPFPIQNNLPHYVYKDKFYFITERKELYELDPETGERNIIGTFPGANINGFGTASVSGDRAIIGFYKQEVEIWELDLIQLRWKRKINFPGVFLGNNLGFFAQDGLFYLLRSTDQPLAINGSMEFWEFDPDGF